MSSPISKSAFIKSEQCLKHFYLYKNHAYLRDNLSKEKQLIFKRGNDVGVFSQQLFPNGIDVTIGEKRDQQLFAQKTKDLIENAQQRANTINFNRQELNKFGSEKDRTIFKNMNKMITLSSASYTFEYLLIIMISWIVIISLSTILWNTI